MSSFSVFLNSSNRDNSGENINDCIYSLPQNLINYNMVNISLDKFVMPNLQFNINKYNNTITYKENSGSSISASLTTGNYNATTLATALTTLMQTNGTLTYTITFDTVSYKFTIAATGNVQLIDGSLNDVLGFINNSANSSSITADFPMRLDGLDLLMVEIPGSFSKNLNTYSNNILDIVPVGVAFGEIITFDNKSYLNQNNISGSSLRQIRVRLLDSNGNKLDLPQNANYSLSIRVNVL
jgi:hypothetical protein